MQFLPFCADRRVMNGAQKSLGNVRKGAWSLKEGGFDFFWVELYGLSGNDAASRNEPI